jgi:hypothetical protein
MGHWLGSPRRLMGSKTPPLRLPCFGPAAQITPAARTCSQ